MMRHLLGLATLSVIALAALSLCERAPAQSRPGSTAAQETAPVQNTGASQKLRDDPDLQEKVTLDAIDLPLGELLGVLSRQLAVDLRTTHPLDDQRITLHIHKLPVHQLMARLAALLSHTPLAPHGYYWESLPAVAGTRHGYRLWRDRHSVQEELEALDFPRMKAAAWLRDLRNMARMTPEQIAAYKTDLPGDYITDPDFQPFRDALKGLSEPQFEALAQGKAALIDPTLFPDQVMAFNKRWNERATQQRSNALAHGLPDPFPGGVPDMPPDPPSLQYRRDDYDEEHPERAALYGLYLQGVALFDAGEMHMVFNPMGYSVPAGPVTEIPDDGRIIDLAPWLQAPGVTPEQRSDIGFTLQALAQAANLSLYEEQFFKTAYWGARPKGLRAMAGTLPTLIKAICAEWGYRAAKVGEDYLFWSATWAQDRAVDVADGIIRKWRQRQKRQGGFTLDDRIEMASQLSWPQLRLTLNILLPDAGLWASRREATALRFLGRLSSLDRAHAMAPEGVAFADLPLWLQDAFVHDLLRSPGGVSADQLRTARIGVRVVPPVRAGGIKYAMLEARSGGNPFWSVALTLPERHHNEAVVTHART